MADKRVTTTRTKCRHAFEVEWTMSDAAVREAVAMYDLRLIVRCQRCHDVLRFAVGPPDPSMQSDVWTDLQGSMVYLRGMMVPVYIFQSSTALQPCHPER